MRTLMLLSAGLLCAAGREAVAQVRIQTAPRAFAYVTGDPDRPMIGVSTGTSGKRDTLGLLIESVTRGSPAEKAGIEEGDRLVSVNGVNLRLSPMDAGESDMDGVASSRLIRELGKLKAGDEVDLRVYRDGSVRNVKVKTVAADELNKEAFGMVSGTFSRANADHGVIGISLGGNGSRRDTLGVLVVGVSDDGPAAKAGIDEGDRIASINGFDLRVAPEDAGTWQVTNARIRRLNREMEKVKPGDAVELRVVTNGQARTVRVEAVKASEIEGEGFFFSGSNGPMQMLRKIQVPNGGVIVRPRISTGIELPTIDLQRSAAVKRLRATEGMLESDVMPKLKQRLEETAKALKSVRRTIIL